MKRIANILLLFSGIVIGLLISELIFRKVVVIRYQFKESLLGMRINPYPGLAYDMMPCDKCKIRINSLGLRGREISPKKSPDKKRILIIGDSATFGAGVIDDNETIPGRLGLRLDEGEDRGKFEVINGGVPGYDIQEIYLHYKYKLSKLNSDIVVYNFFPNDFLNAKYRVEKIDGKPTLVRMVNAEMPGLQFTDLLPERLNIFLNENSLLYRYTLFYISHLFANLNPELSNFMGRYQMTNVRYLYLLKNEVEKNKPIFVVSSEIYSFCARCKEPLNNEDCPEDKGCKATYLLLRWIEREMKELHIPYVCLSDAISDMDLKDVMIDNFAHYTAKANVIMGDRLYEFLKSNILIE